MSLILSPSSYDVKPIIAALASLVSVNMTPWLQGTPTLNYVYSALPKMFSESPPFMFFEYMGGTNVRDNYGDYPTSHRVWKVNAVAVQCLLSEQDTADAMTQTFVGAFYELIRQSHSLGVMGAHGEATVVSDQVMPFPGATPSQSFLCNVFSVEIEDFIN